MTAMPAAAQTHEPTFAPKHLEHKGKTDGKTDEMKKEVVKPAKEIEAKKLIKENFFNQQTIAKKW